MGRRRLGSEYRRERCRRFGQQHGWIGEVVTAAARLGGLGQNWSEHRGVNGAAWGAGVVFVSAAEETTGSGLAGDAAWGEIDGSGERRARA
ncbi:hypothetical protein M0R45_025444 [Rubus argutus]|uniref:MHC class I antigen n=1 Tax=Rubus argutus TaxID=59490 RepID=A0AAW1WX42_RUBAR